MRRKLEVSGSIHTTKAKFKNAALFLRLGLLSTRRTSIRHENRRSFSKMLFKVEDLKMPAFRFSVDWKQFENGDVTIITWFLFSKVDNKQIQSNRWFLRFCISLARGVRACKPCKHWLTTFFNLKFCRNLHWPEDHCTMKIPTCFVKTFKWDKSVQKSTKDTHATGIVFE